MIQHRIAMGLAAFLWAAALLLAPVSATAGVQTIEVLADITGESPLDAQQKAVDYAKKRAFFLLLAKLAPEKAETIARSLSDEQIYANVRGYEVVQDKLEGNHYLANYKVSVSEDLIQRLLVSDAPAMDNSQANPMVVVPVFTDAQGRTLLWEPDNIWRSMMNSVALERGEGLLLMPYGDPTDTHTTDGSTVLSYGYEPLEPLAKRYGGGEIVVAHAQVKADKQPAGLLITLRRLGPGFDKLKDIYFETDGLEQTPESLMPEAARSISDQLKEVARYYKGDEEKKIINAKQMRVRSSFRRLSDWVQMQTLLAGLPRVVRVKVDTISIQSAEATLYYEGTPEAMLEIMNVNGVRATPDGDVTTLQMF